MNISLILSRCDLRPIVVSALWWTERPSGKKMQNNEFYIIH